MDEHTPTRQFRRLGDLIPTMPPPRAVDGTPSEPNTRSNNSEITTPRLSHGDGSITSARFGENGLVAPERLQRALATNDPRMVDHALICTLPSSVRATLNERRVSLIGPYGFDEETEGFELVEPEKIPVSDFNHAAWLVGLTLTGTPRPTLMEELLRVRICTRMREQDLMTEKAMLSYFADELARYPYDAIFDACRDWVRRETFFPTIAELRAECDRRVRRRKKLQQAL